MHLRPLPPQTGYDFGQDEFRSLRWWVISNQTMWYGESTHDRLTDLFRILAIWQFSIGRKANRADPLSERREREVLSGVRLIQTATKKNRVKTESLQQERSFFEGWVVEFGPLRLPGTFVRLRNRSE